MRNRSLQWMLIAAVCGLAAGFTDWAWLLQVATLVSGAFVKMLQLISIPVIFLAIISTIISMETLGRFKRLGGSVFKYTVITTLMASTIALIMFVLIDPVPDISLRQDLLQQTDHASYVDVVFNMIPNNLVKAFLDNNVIGIAVLAFLFGIVTLSLPAENKQTLLHLFSSLFQMFVKVAQYVIFLLPLAVFAFVMILVDGARHDPAQLDRLLKFLLVVLSANLIQAFVVLPLMLKYKGIQPSKVFMAVLPALTTAFFSRSSSATLPLTIECVSKQPISKKVVNFSLPLCTVINMNGCAAFILAAVLFVGMSTGMEFSVWHMIAWIFLATLAAIGNASVPMGCYFLASAFLLSMGIDSPLMGQILAVYVIIDMVETALNVWSDCVVTSIVGKEIGQAFDET